MIYRKCSVGIITGHKVAFQYKAPTMTSNHHFDYHTVNIYIPRQPLMDISQHLHRLKQDMTPNTNRNAFMVDICTTHNGFIRSATPVCRFHDVGRKRKKTRPLTSQTCLRRRKPSGNQPSLEISSTTDPPGTCCRRKPELCHETKLFASMCFLSRRLLRFWHHLKCLWMLCHRQ